MYFVYILKMNNGNFYTGFTSNLAIRLKQHSNGFVYSTSRLLPVELIYFECYLREADARRNERYYKTSKGKADL